MNPVIDAISLRSKPVSPLKFWVFAAVGVALLPLAGCLPSSEANKLGANGVQNPGPQSFDKPIIAQADLPAGDKKNNLDLKTLPLATVPVKGLLQSTSTTQRTQQASMNLGRDPFSALPPTSLSLPSISTTTSAPVPILPKSAVGQKQTTPKGAAKQPKAQKPASAPQLPQLRPVARPANMPTIPVQNNLPVIAPPPLALTPPAPVVSPTELAEQVEVTGVVQVGMRSMAIVRAPGEGSSRHVSVGDRLSGGRIVVREIRVTPSGQPSVVLEQNGQTIVKAIGASRMASARSI